MKKMESVIIFETKTFEDCRGYFRETFRHNDLSHKLLSLGFDISFVQENESFSRQGVLRGLHFQKNPQAQAKLVRVSYGRVFDVAVDLRSQSPTYKKWWSYELSAENGHQIFIPEGFAHGFFVLSSEAVLNYKVSSYYDPSSDGGLIWNDPDINIQWPFQKNFKPIVSDKDASLPALSDLDII